MTPSQTKLLEDLRSGAVLASVKLLEWTRWPDDGSRCAESPTGREYLLRAKVSYGAYFVLKGKGVDGDIHYYGRTGSALWSKDADTVEEIQAAAQADYEARIRSALSPSPALVEMIEGMVRERDEAEAEAEHFARVSCDDLGKNPPVFWRDRALAAEAERDALREALAVTKALAQEARVNFREEHYGVAYAALAQLREFVDATLTKEKTDGE